ncbi:MAG: putative lipid II flippase FtsW [Pseudomonas sp.]
MRFPLPLSPSPLFSRRGIDVDFPLLAGCLALLGLGFVMVTSASSEVAAGQQGNALYYMIRQLAYLLIGFFCALPILFIPLENWRKHSGRLFIVAVVLLVLVLVPGIGREVNGARRWIGLGFFNIQPSEVAKMFVVIYLASYLSRHQVKIKTTWAGVLIPLMAIGCVAPLLLAEPDFGATVVMAGAGVAMLFLSGVNLWRFLPLMAGVVVLGIFVMTMESYRLKRLTNFIDPWADQYGAGYQLSQALIAFGRGEWFGVGLGNSVQKQFYLPEAHTDFVFSILAEELGMFGALCTVALFVMVTLRGLIIGLRAEREKLFFSAYVAYGLSILWIGQFIINIGVNIGLLPTKGLTLPFLSYGGSSLIICCVSLALLLRIDWERRNALGNAEIEFSESDFFDEEKKHGA